MDFALEDILENKTLYIEAKKDILENIFINGEYSEEKNRKLTFSYRGEEYECTQKELLITLILARVFIEMDAVDKFSEEFLFSYNDDGKVNLESYLDKIIKLFREDLNEVSFPENGKINDILESFKTSETEKLTDSIADILLEISQLAVWTNLNTGVSVSLYELYQMSKKSKRLDEIFHTDLSSVQSFAEMENLINELSAEACKIICSFDSNSYKDMLNSGTINKGQFKQVTTAIGPRPSITGQIIPEIINTNFLRGLRNLQDYYILMETARKILIISHIQVRRSGYMTRKLSLLTMDTILDKACNDCGSKYFVSVNISSESLLKRYYDRWFLDEESEQLKLLNEKYVEEKGLDYFIGKTMFFRSPMTCACPDGKTCKTCYGELYHVNKNYHIGLIAVLLFSPKITQNLLSAKHLLQTKSEDILWSEEFLQFFTVEQSEVSVSEEVKGYLRIEQDELKEDEETGELFFENCKIEVPAVGLRERSLVELNFPTPLYLVDEIAQQMVSEKDAANSYYEINLSRHNLETIFYLRIMNEEITAKLNLINKILEESDHNGASDIDSLLGQSLKMLEDNNITLNAVHMELILKNLIRDGDDESKYADFSKPETEMSYQLVPLKRSILESDRLAASISFEEVKAQIYSPKTYKKRGKSMLDTFYKV